MVAMGICRSTPIDEDPAEPLGISFSYLLHWYEKNNAEIGDRTTSEVCSELIKPATCDKTCEFLRLPHVRDSYNAFGTANIFVSHAWSYKFKVLLNAIEKWQLQKGRLPSTMFLWIDIFVVNQHSGITDFGHWTESFRVSLRQIKYALIVLSPWDAPTWSVRAWCLFEYFVMLADQIEQDFVLPKEEETDYIRCLRSSDPDRKFELLRVISGIDMEKAASFNKSDEDGIKGFVRTMPGGFQEVNTQVISALRQWYSATAEAYLKNEAEDPLQAYGLTDGFMMLLLDLGEYQKAEQLARSRLASQESALSLLGPDRDADRTKLAGAICASRQRLAQALEKLAQYDESLAVYERAIADRTRILGVRDVSVADAYNNIGNIHLHRGHFEEALRWYEQDLSVRIPALGEEHVTVAYTRVNIGAAYRGLGRLDEALAAWRGALEAEIRELGPNHAEVAGAWKNVGMALRALGRGAEAAEAYRTALAIETTQLGAGHPSVARTLANLGVLRLHAGDFAEALRLYEEAARILEAHVGPASLDVAYLRENSGSALWQMGERARAAALYKVARRPPQARRSLPAALRRSAGPMVLRR